MSRTKPHLQPWVTVHLTKCLSGTLWQSPMGNLGLLFPRDRNLCQIDKSERGTWWTHTGAFEQRPEQPNGRNGTSVGLSENRNQGFKNDVWIHTHSLSLLFSLLLNALHHPFPCSPEVGRHVSWQEPTSGEGLTNAPPGPKFRNRLSLCWGPTLRPSSKAREVAL